MWFRNEKRLTNRHSSDRDIVMLLDGELSQRRARDARTHLEACWLCRARMHELEETITGYVRARSAQLDAKIPSPTSGANFRVRLQEAAATSVSQESSFGRRMIPAAAMVLAAAAFVGVFGNMLRGDASTPLHRLTPGETRPVTLRDVCDANFREETVRRVSEAVRRQVFAEYGMRDAAADAYEVDYLITPGLGGADSIRNMWPQPYSARWNARVKDQLEDHLHSLVCAGKIDLATAQREIAADWIGAYKRYFRTDKPL